MKRILAFFALAMVSFSALAQEPLKVLAIGNSFSEDAVEQNLYEIAAAAGKDIIIGNMYIGGCTIDRHLECIEGDKPEYRYRKIKDGQMSEKWNFKLSDAITDEEWDIVSVQQASGYSGLPESYARLGELCEWVRANAPQARIIFHQTWAYSKTSNHNHYPWYDRDQQRMFQAILSASGAAVKANGIKTVMPSGRAIQLARGTALDAFGDDLTRDGFHLDRKAGRYIAAATWYEVLFGKSVVGNKYCPDTLDPKQLRIAQKCAHRAVRQQKRVR